MRIEAVDPGGVIAANIEVDRVIGCVVYPASEMIAPAVIRHDEGNRFSVGELDGVETPRVKMVSELFRKAGFKSPVLKRHPFRDLDQALGQCVLQPDQRTDPRHAGGHLPVSAQPRAGGEDDDGGPDDRRTARRPFPRPAGTADRRRRGRGRRTRRRCSRTSNMVEVSSSMPWSARSSSWAGSRDAHSPHRRGLRLRELLAKTLHDQKGRLRIEPVG